jgi:hypothetical protein
MEMFERHLPYEIDMLRVTYLMLSTPGAPLWFTPNVLNALIESFCVHARNLIEFYIATNSLTDETVAAQHFTKDYKAFPNKLPRRIIGKLNSQITHLSYNREDDSGRKIGHEDRKVIMALLETEMERFATHLNEPYRSKWREDLKVGIKLGAMAQAASPASATNAIQVATLDIPPSGPVGPSVTLHFPAEGPTGPKGP